MYVISMRRAAKCLLVLVSGVHMGERQKWSEKRTLMKNLI